MQWRRLQRWILLSGLAVSTAAWACPDCPTSEVVRGSVLGEGFWGYLTMAVMPFPLLGALSAMMSRVGRQSRNQGAIISAGVLLGTGLGGFLDGILLHQILQWHSMLSSRLPPTDLVSMKVNMFWDGLFHAFTWLTTVIGLGLLWRAGGRPEVPWSTRTFVGSLALGWGAFNVVEGLIDHHLLGIHHVHPGEGQLAWDVGFLVFGALLVAVGWGLIRGASRRENRPRRAGASGPGPGLSEREPLAE